MEELVAELQKIVCSKCKKGMYNCCKCKVVERIQKTLNESFI